MRLSGGLGLVIASLSVGPVLDRWGKKSAFVPALLVIAAALFGLHWADTFVTIAALAFALDWAAARWLLQHRRWYLICTTQAAQLR